MTGIAESPVFASLVAKFVKNLPLRLAALQSAEKLSDWAEIARLAHQMAGAAGSYGFPMLSEVAARIEVQAKGDTMTEELARSIVAFDSLCTRMVYNKLN